MLSTLRVCPVCLISRGNRGAQLRPGWGQGGGHVGTLLPCGGRGKEHCGALHAGTGQSGPSLKTSQRPAVGWAIMAQVAHLRGKWRPQSAARLTALWDVSVGSGAAGLILPNREGTRRGPDGWRFELGLTWATHAGCVCQPCGTSSTWLVGHKGCVCPERRVPGQVRTACCPVGEGMRRTLNRSDQGGQSPGNQARTHKVDGGMGFGRENEAWDPHGWAAWRSRVI